MSDTGRIFKGAAKDLRAIVRQGQVQQCLTEKRVRWIPNVEWGLLVGGVFEHLITSTERCLRKMVG